MDRPVPPMNLSALLGALRQDTREGELILKQNDGVRRLYLSEGELIHLRSEVAGEQFGSYLLRKGIFDSRMLTQLLASDEPKRIGVKVIQGGLLTPKERDEHLQSLQEMIMVHALDLPILSWAWNPGPEANFLSYDLHFQLQHRHFIWRTFQGSNDLTDLVDVLEHKTTWKWKGQGDLLTILGELPLTPSIAYALTFLSDDPISFETFHFLSNLDRADAGRLIGTLWALGALALSEGEMPSLPLPGPPSASAKQAFDLPPAPVSDVRLHDLPPGKQNVLPPPQPGITTRPETIKQAPNPGGQPAPPPDRPRPQLPAAPSSHEGQARKLINQARQQSSSGSEADAIHTLESAISLRPVDDDAYEIWMMLGKLRMANPAWSSRAIAELRHATQICPGKAEPWIALGEIYRGMGFDLDATNCYLKARKLDPSVQIPLDVDFSAQATAVPQPKGKKKGILSSLHTFLGGGGKT